MVLQNLFRQISNPWPPRTRPHHTQNKLRLMKKQTVSSCCPDESSTDIVILSLLPAHDALCLVGQQPEKNIFPTPSLRPSLRAEWLPLTGVQPEPASRPHDAEGGARPDVGSAGPGQERLTNLRGSHGSLRLYE